MVSPPRKAPSRAGRLPAPSAKTVTPKATKTKNTPASGSSSTAKAEVPETGLARVPVTWTLAEQDRTAKQATLARKSESTYTDIEERLEYLLGAIRDGQLGEAMERCERIKVIVRERRDEWREVRQNLELLDYATASRNRQAMRE